MEGYCFNWNWMGLNGSGWVLMEADGFKWKRTG